MIKYKCEDCGFEFTEEDINMYYAAAGFKDFKIKTHPEVIHCLECNSQNIKECIEVIE